MNTSQRITWHVEIPLTDLSATLKDIGKEFSIGFAVVPGFGIYDDTQAAMSQVAHVVPRHAGEDYRQVTIRARKLAIAVTTALCERTGQTCVLPVIDTVDYICTCAPTATTHPETHKEQVAGQNAYR